MDRAVVEELVRAAKRLQVLAELVTIKQVMDSGHPAIEAAGLNPWCVNEGLATGNETLSLWRFKAAIEAAESELNKPIDMGR